MNPWLIAAPTAVATVAGLTAYAAAYPRAQLFGSTICRTNSSTKLAITFDDGPNPAITPQLLDLLQRYDARATFFLIGGFARQCPDLVRETLARGHTIGNHTDSHPNLFSCTPRQIRAQLLRCNDALSNLLGQPPKWFRPPYGLRNPWVIPTSRQLAMRTVMWTLMPGDWNAKSAEWLIPRMEPIATNAQRRLRTNAVATTRTPTVLPSTGDILCLHDGDHRHLNGDRGCTLAALAHWLPRWRDLGLEFVTIDQAVRSPAT